MALIPEPRELLKIAAKFSFEEKRIFPEPDRLSGGLYPHTTSVTYQLDEDGKVA